MASHGGSLIVPFTFHDCFVRTLHNVTIFGNVMEMDG